MSPTPLRDVGPGDAHGDNFVARAARWSATHRRTAILGWIAFVIAAIAIGGAVGQKKMTDADQYPGESGRGQQALQDARLTPNTEMVLVQSRDGSTTVRSAEFQGAVRELGTRLKATPHVKAVRTPLDRTSPVAEDGRSALVQYDVAGDLEEAQDRVGATQDVVRSVAAEHPELKVQQYGAASANNELSDTIEQDLHKAEKISMPITLLILLFACGSLVAAGLPLILAFSAVIATMSLVALPSQIFPVNDNVASIILLVGLAVGVDYALFYLRREREERDRGHTAEEALQIAAQTSGHAVFVSGLTVMAAMVGMFLTGDNMFTSLASGATLVVAVAMVASISVLPAIMAWLGERVDLGRMPKLRRRRSPRADRGGVWSVIIDRVMRRPLLAFLAAAGLLVALSIPVLGMNTKVTAITDLPKDVSTMKAYHDISQVFPAEAAKASVVVRADDVRSGEVANGISALEDRAEGTHVAIGEIRTSVSDDGRTALVEVPIAGTGSDQTSIDATNALRDDIIPATIGRVDQTRVDVTGDAAKSIDQDKVMAHSLPIVFGFVLTLTFLLMLFTFRSIVIPLGTIVLNMLSVGAAYGVLVLVFQHGLGENVLDFTSNGGITSWLPLFLFVILFGLSMDYHVFILSRVREAYDKGMSTDDAIRHGISSTAGTVTSAAIVMVAVFAAFATLSFVDMKEMGVGLAAAVLIDATIIRGVLLPAGMKLLGDRTWYLPRILARTPLGRRRVVAEPQPARA
jgi:RND superfamily putative drug exporter